MNRFIEKRGECYALKSAPIREAVKELREHKGWGYNSIAARELLTDIESALQLANCIALAEKHAPYTKAPQPEPKSKDREQLERLLETHEPDIQSVYWPSGTALQKLEITFRSKTMRGTCGASNYKPVSAAAREVISVKNSNPVARVVSGDHEFTPKPKPSSTDKYLEVCGRGKRLRDSDMGITLDLRIPNNMRPTQVIDSMPINVKIGPSVIWIKYNAEKNAWEEILAEPEQEPESKASKPNLRKYKTLGFSGRGKPLVCMACGKDTCSSLRQALEEWEKFHAEPEPKATTNKSTSANYLRWNKAYKAWEVVAAEPEQEPVKPEQLDPKACRQFVEQLLAFDELEKNRAEDIDRILVALLSNPYIGVLSYLTFFEAYKK